MTGAGHVLIAGGLGFLVRGVVDTIRFARRARRANARLQGEARALEALRWESQGWDVTPPELLRADPSLPILRDTAWNCARRTINDQPEVHV